MKFRAIFLFGFALVPAFILSACVHHPVKTTSDSKPKTVAATNSVAVPGNRNVVVVTNNSPAPAPAPVVSTPAVYVPNTSHMNDPLPDGVFAFDSISQSTDVAADAAKAEFLFNFTNVSAGKVAILNVHPSCGCTTAKLPQLPWIIPAGGSGEIPITVNLAGKSGNVFKTVNFSTEKGSKMLMLRINIQPPVVPKLTEADRMRGIEMAKVDRQAVFKNDCATCHIKNIQGKYGKDLYDSVCSVCHEAENRATMVPNLHELKVPTNIDFWRTWISFGKPGTLMPSFSASQGGPLTDMQVESLAAYLNATIPSHVQPHE